MALQRSGRLTDIQASQVEVGRIRLGTTTPKTSRAGKAYNEPVRLDRFRLTSRSELLIAEAAELYGGEPQPWTPQNSSVQQYEVIIERNSLPVIVPPDPVSQYYEVWSGGRCQRRCDGRRELLEDQACICGPEPAQRLCKPTTRLSIMLAEMRGIGVWRLETHGYYAAAELPAVADLLSKAGGNVAARLELEARSAEIPDPRNQGKTVISTFMVPVLHVEATPREILQLFAAPERAALETSPERPALEAAPADDPEEILRRSWVVYGELESEIAAATTRETMMAVKDRIAQSDQMMPDHVKELQTRWSERARAIQANGNPASAPATPQEPTPTSTSPAAAAGMMDRQTAWMKIQTWAGFQTPALTLSDLKKRYAEAHNGAELTGATADDLVAFGNHLGVTW